LPENSSKSAFGSYDVIFSALDRYITIPESLIPRTTMNFGGLQHSQERADLNAFLLAQTR
jgi:cytochrome c2